ncbi:MAG: UvrD-helicase domain-containing protein, partial [Gammaproteobacteria bacterium]|nr:UvrD-helicase domain-containing protein [Gammaproteobacteria bacterium]
MTVSHSLDLMRIPLSGRNLIEASAGTGKTYTMVGIYIRLILETDLDVSRILVMTFTNAATDELRERLRTGLIRMLSVLNSEDQAGEPFLSQLKQKVANNQATLNSAIQKLQLSISCFDQAAVYTIHGFCQRVLSDSALETGLDFENELMPSDDEWIEAIADDYWRKHFHQAGRRQLLILKLCNLTPLSLAQSVKNWVGKPYLHVLPLDDCFVDDAL